MTKYTPYARQLDGDGPAREARRARAIAYFDEMMGRIDLKALLTEMLRDRMGMVYPDAQVYEGGAFSRPEHVPADDDIPGKS